MYVHLRLSKVIKTTRLRVEKDSFNNSYSVQLLFVLLLLFLIFFQIVS